MIMLSLRTSAHTGVAIPQLDGKNRIYEMFENPGDSHASVCTGSE